MIHYDHLFNAEIISAFSIYLTLQKIEIEFTNFEWDLSYSMICLDLLTTVHYCNLMTWYQVISAWVVNVDFLYQIPDSIFGSDVGFFPSEELLQVMYWQAVTMFQCSLSFFLLSWRMALNSAEHRLRDAIKVYLDCNFLFCFLFDGHCCPMHCDIFRSIVLPRI